MTVEVFLVRHAAALPAQAGQSDSERLLSAEGRTDFGRCVKSLRRLELRFDRVLHSPLLRAVETAELLLPLARGESVVTQGLAEPPADSLFTEVGAREEERLALVGHEPWMSELASLLLFGDVSRSHALSFKKGGVAWLRGSFEPGGMNLYAFLPPRVLRRGKKPA